MLLCMGYKCGMLDYNMDAAMYAICRDKSEDLLIRPP